VASRSGSGAVLLYHETFERLRVGGRPPATRTWTAGGSLTTRAALDVPFGLVDLVEVLQAGTLHTAQWYDFLNLGYRLVPIAGSDWPYIDMVGSVRNMVHVEGGLTPDRWFEALRAGRTFVTSGPMLTLRVGEADGTRSGRPGDRGPRTATQSPDLGPIERLSCGPRRCRAGVEP
jgi:hypothetical protein